MSALKAVANMKNPYWLELSKTGLTNDGIQTIATNAKIVRLYLNESNKIDNAGLKCLEGKTLAELRLNSARIDDEGLESVAKIKGLLVLPLDFIIVTDAGLAKLGNSLPTLMTVSLNDCPLLHPNREKRLR
jgi:hypothetical protein